MRVAYVCTDMGVPVHGLKGCSLHVQEVLRTLVARRAAVDLLAVRMGGDAPAGFESVRAVRVPVRDSENAADREQALIQANGSLRSLLEASGPFDLVYERHSLWGCAAMEWASEHRVPGILEVNAPLIEEQFQHRTLVDHDSARQLAVRSVKSAKVVACVSDKVADYARSLGADESQTIVVPNGVRPERFTPCAARLSADAPFRVGFVGSLRPWHAVGDLVSAFAAMRAAGDECSELLIVGHGPLHSALQEQVAGLPEATRRSVQFVGAVAPDSVFELLAEFDVAVAPYAADNDCYFSPLKLFEYMAAGLPVVAACSGQMRHIISDGVHGYLYRPGDIGDLASKLDQVRREPKVAAKMGQTARAEVIARHTWDHRVCQLLSAADVRVPEFQLA